MDVTDERIIELEGKLNQKSKEMAERDKKIAEMEKDLKNVMAMAQKYMNTAENKQ